MRIKKSSVISLISTLAITCTYWLETPHYKLWRLNKAISHEIKNVYSSIYVGLIQTLRRDGVLVLTMYDHRSYRVFSSDIEDFADAAAVVFARYCKLNFAYTHICTPQDVYDYVSANPQCIYFVLSPHTIRVFRMLDGIGKDVYYLQNFFDVFARHCLPVFFRKVLENLHEIGPRACSAIPLVDNSEILIKSEESLCTRTYHIDLKCIGLFSYTAYTGAPGEYLQIYTDMRYIFARSVESIMHSLSKRKWLERYIEDIAEYLYSRNMISTLDMCAYPDLIPSLFPFHFVSLSTNYFRKNEMVRGGICFGKILKKAHLASLVSQDAFRQYDSCLGTLYFTEFVKM